MYWLRMHSVVTHRVIVHSVKMASSIFNTHARIYCVGFVDLLKMLNGRAEAPSLIFRLYN